MSRIQMSSTGAGTISTSGPNLRARAAPTRPGGMPQFAMRNSEPPGRSLRQWRWPKRLRCFAGNRYKSIKVRRIKLAA
jgi:hypothetical protein